MTADSGDDRVDLARQADFRLGGILVLPSTRQVDAGGALETLEPRVMQVLVALARRAGHVVSREDLIRSCWEGRSVGDDALNRSISKVRKLGEAHAFFRLETIPRVGYRLLAEDTAPRAEAAEPQAAAAMLLDSDVTRIERTKSAWWRRLTVMQISVGAAGVALLVLTVAALALWQSGGRTALARSIAVLPFANLSGDPAKDYLARGVAVEIIDKLSQLDGMAVISRNSSFTFGADADARKVGAELKVAHVLTGTVREENGRISMTAELVDAKSGTTIWTQPFQADFTANGLDAVRRQIAAKVSGAMSIAFNVDRRARPSGSGTQSLDAYEFYLRGLDEWWYKFNRDMAADLFARAVDLDPDYADAWAGLAISTASQWTSLPPVEAKEQFEEADRMARRAVDLDPDLSVAQAVFGAVSTALGEWDLAEAATLRALKISRTDMALNNREMLLLRTGRVNSAYTTMLELRQVDPLRGPDDVALFPILSSTGRHDELKEIMSHDDWAESGNIGIRRHFFVVLARINAGDTPASIRQALEAISRRQEQEPARFARALLAVFDNPAKARSVLRSWYEDKNFQNILKWDLIPILAAWYGDTDLVLRVWREELPIVTPRTVFIWGAAFSTARATPEFKTLMRDIGLLDYWRAHGWADKCRPVGDDDFECA